MSVELLGQSILNGLAAGWIYILVAVGLTLVFGIMNIIQFAHGEVYMLGAYTGYYLFTLFGFNFWESLPVTIVVMGLLGLVLEKFFFRPFRDKFELSVIVAIGLMVLLQTIAVVAFGTDTRMMASIIEGVIVVGGITLAWDRLLAIFIGIVLIVALFIVIQKTKIGQAMLAVSQDPVAASLQGIDINLISSISMIVGSILAGIAGLLIGRIFSVYPFMGTFAMTKGIAVVILGGLGSIPGAIAGGLILGLIDGIIPPILNPTITSIIGFTVIIILLLVRPRGLLGRPATTEVSRAFRP